MDFVQKAIDQANELRKRATEALEHGEAQTAPLLGEAAHRVAQGARKAAEAADALSEALRRKGPGPK